MTIKTEGEQTEMSEGNESVLIINEDVTVIEYAPKVFAYLRQLDGIDKHQLKKSLDPEENREQAFKAGESSGKSGSFFFFSKDSKFIIKTMTDSDLATFHKIFKKYFDTVDRRRKSLLARIYGVYTIKMEDLVPVHLVLMGNTKKFKEEKNLLRVFDLKGSEINRVNLEKNLEAKSTLKDINLQNLKSEKLLMFTEED